MLLYHREVTDYMIGREKGQGSGGLLSFWKASDPILKEHALSPRHDKPICGYEGEVEISDNRWYESESKNRCEGCVARTEHY